MKKSRLLGAVFACVLSFTSIPSYAATIIIDFTSTVTTVNTSYLTSSSGLVSATGTGHIEYDMNPDQSGASSTIGLYSWDSPNAIFTFELPAGGMTFSAGSGGTSIGGSGYRDVAVEVSNDRFTTPKDEMRFWGNRMTQTLEGYDTRMTLYYGDSTASALTNVDLSNILNPSLYDIEFFSIAIGVGGGVTTAGLSFSVDSISVSAVPIPPAVWLFGSGMLGLVGMARRKKAG